MILIFAIVDWRIMQMIFKGINRVTQTYGGSHGGIDIVGDTTRPSEA